MVIKSIIFLHKGFKNGGTSGRTVSRVTKKRNKCLPVPLFLWGIHINGVVEILVTYAIVSIYEWSMLIT